MDVVSLPGRTGRAGRSGEAITFFTNEDAPYLKMYVCSFPCAFQMGIVGLTRPPFLSRIANVMRQSGCEVPEWMTAFVSLLPSSISSSGRLSCSWPGSISALLPFSLKNPSKKQRKQIKKKPLERTDVRTVGGAGIGRQKAVKQREMVEGSKRRKTKEVAGRGGKGGAGAGGEKEVDLAEGGDDESD
jgi:ATP-dependent RNA helicase DDX52/ROK1